MNIIIPQETILSASQILLAALEPGHAGGKRVRRQVQARIVRGVKALHLLPDSFRAAYAGLVLDSLGNQYLIFIEEGTERQLDKLVSKE